MNRNAKLRSAAVALGAIVALGCAFAVPASARVIVGFGVMIPVAPWYYPPPVVYGPPPVAPPVQPAYLSQPQSDWYYCDNPRGYYPYVTACSTTWRAVPHA